MITAVLSVRVSALLTLSPWSLQDEFPLNWGIFFHFHAYGRKGKLPGVPFW